MSPDSIEAVRERVARLEQRADDLMQRVLDKFADFTEDVRQFAPLVREHDEMRAEMRFVRETLTQLLASHAALETRFDEERNERMKGQAERKAEIEANREERNAEIARIEADREKQTKELQARSDQQRAENRRMFYGLLGIFITAAAGVVAQILGGGGT